MKLQELIREVPVLRITGDPNTEIHELAYDSRKVQDGSLFFCIQGYKTDGHAYAAEAVKKGAAALMVSQIIEHLDVPQIIVADDRLCMALMSANFFGRPSEKMKMIGVTGTKGKTSTTYMIKAIAESYGRKIGLIGTIVDMIGERKIYTEKTTPESLDLQRLLKQMLDEGVDWVTMEVSSHSLELKRVAGIQYDVAVFTNLTHDHLDFHGNMDNYKAAKRKLFDSCRAAVFNRDDEAYAYMEKGLTCPIIHYGLGDGNEITASDIVNSPSGISYTLHLPKEKLAISVKTPGMFMVYNSLAACAVMHLMGVPSQNLKEGLENILNVPGRFELVDNGGRKFTLILDYAHTPDSLEQTLKTARGFAQERLVTLFGCGGDRDRAKRPIMGEIAGKLSDFTIITSDNPRTEEPSSIIDMIVEGMRQTKGRYICIENRREAMRYALQNARPGDLIILAGKGHETYQEIHGVRYPFDEKEVVGELLKELS